MRTDQIAVLACLACTAFARQMNHPVVIRKAVAYQNTTSTSTSISTSTPDTSKQTTLSTSHSTTHTTNLTTTLSTTTTIPKTLEKSTYYPSSIVSTQTGECVDSTVTYLNTDPPPTVYVTVDGSYDVTVTGSNAVLTDKPILVTPPPACVTTVLGSSYGTLISISAATTHPHAGPMYSTEGQSTYSVSYAQNVAVTSTVIITKKTPVAVVQIPTTNPPVTFEQPKTDNNVISPAATPAAQTHDDSNGGGSNASPTGDNSSGGSSNGNPAAPAPAPAPAVATGLASIIASVINSPFAVPGVDTPVTTNAFVAAPATTSVAGAAVSVGPSGVAIGSSTIPMPSGSQATVVVGGQTYTVKSNEIVAPGTTYAFASQVAPGPTITQEASTVTAAGITFEVGATSAVIAGTTYRIGAGAKSTTVVVNGQTISIGTNGVGFPGDAHTTFAPAMTVAGDYELVIVSGLTVYIDQTEAIISGTTVKVGPGATPTSLVFRGTTVLVGPGGVSLSSTTIVPTSVPSVTASTTTMTSPSTSASEVQQVTAANTSTQFSGSSANRSLFSSPLNGLLALLSSFFILL